MKPIVALAAVAAVSAVVVIASDIHQKRAAAAVVDRVWLDITGGSDVVSRGLLQDAENELHKRAKRILLFPSAPVKNAASEIHSQLFRLDMLRDELRVLGDDEVGQRLAKKSTERYASEIPEFKDKLSYIRRTL